MENFNKVISFVLGLIVVVVFLAVISGRFNLKNRLLSGNQTKTTPTVTPTIEANPPLVTPISGKTTQTYNKYQAKTPNSIPSTGSSTLLLPFVFSALGSGLFLRKIGRKK